MILDELNVQMNEIDPTTIFWFNENQSIWSSATKSHMIIFKSCWITYVFIRFYTNFWSSLSLSATVISSKEEQIK